MTESDKIKSEREALSLEREKLELEKLRHDVAVLQQQAARGRASRQQVERDLKDFRLRQKLAQDLCNHHKGGTNLEGLYGRGNDPQFSLVKHQLPLGDWCVICQRCQKVWLKDDENYEEMLNAQTRNSPSGSMMFQVSAQA